MLILSRKKDERILINENIEISIIEIKGDQVRLGISAPQDVKIFRHEVYLSTQRENEAAAQSGHKILPDLDFLSRMERDK